MFLAALQIAGPLVAVLFLADVALGLLTRVAPALNAFALGFPAKILTHPRGRRHRDDAAAPGRPNLVDRPYTRSCQVARGVKP